MLGLINIFRNFSLQKRRKRVECFYKVFDKRKGEEIQWKKGIQQRKN